MTRTDNTDVHLLDPNRREGAALGAELRLMVGGLHLYRDFRIGLERHREPELLAEFPVHAIGQLTDPVVEVSAEHVLVLPQIVEPLGGPRQLFPREAVERADLPLLAEPPIVLHD